MNLGKPESRRRIERLVDTSQPEPAVIEPPADTSDEQAADSNSER